MKPKTKAKLQGLLIDAAGDLHIAHHYSAYHDTGLDPKVRRAIKRVIKWSAELERSKP